MISERDFDRLARAWLEQGLDEAPDRVVAAVLQAAETTPQVRRRVAWPTWRPYQMNRLLILVGAAVLLVALIGGGVFIGGRAPSSTAIPSQDAAASAAPAASPSSTPIPSQAAAASGTLRVPGIAVDLRTAIPLATIDVGGFPYGTGGDRVASDGSTLWLGKDSEVVGIDPSSSTVRTRFPVYAGAYSSPIAAPPGAIWTEGPGSDPASVTHWDSKTGKSVASVPVAGALSPLFADGSIWVPEATAGSVIRIDPATNKILATIPMGSAGSPPALDSVVAGDGSIWVSNSTSGEIARIDPRTNKVVGTIHPAESAGDMTVAGGTIWDAFAGNVGSTVSRIDAASGKTSWVTPLDGVTTNLLARPDAVWVGLEPYSASLNGVIVALDPTSGKIVDGLSIPNGQVSALFEGFGSVWVVLGNQGIVERFSPDVLTVKH